ncbi:MAG: hypothetical protein ACOVP1_11700 [Bacteroidia bacterium]
MNAYYFCEPNVNEVMCAVEENGVYKLKMLSVYEPNINYKIYIDSSRLFFLINEVRWYITVDTTPSTTLEESKKYALKLSSTRDENGSNMNDQIWLIQINSQKIGLSFLYPTRTIRSEKEYDFSIKTGNSNNLGALKSSVRIFYDTTTKLIQTIAFNANVTYANGSSKLSTNFENTYCLFLMDNREYKITSKLDNRKYLNYSDNSLTIGENRSWRIEPIPGSRYVFGGKYFIVFLDPVIANKPNYEGKLAYKENVILIDKTGDLSEACQWELIFIPNTDSCLLKNVASGKFLSVLSGTNNLIMEDSYNPSVSLISNADTLRKQWLISSSITAPQN